MLKKILAALAAIGAFFSALFYVLMKQAKDEQKIKEAEVKAEKAQSRADVQEAARNAENAVSKKKAEQEAEDEELSQRVHSGDGLDSFNAGLDMLRRQAERGNKRNTSTGNSGA
jgi:membrane protein involved in colicin uptake